MHKDVIPKHFGVRGAKCIHDDAFRFTAQNMYDELKIDSKQTKKSYKKEKCEN